MSGLKITIPTSFTDTSLPILRDDPLLTAGSLALIEPGHPANKLIGVPTTGTLLPNIAHAEAAAVLGIGDDGIPATFSNVNIAGVKGLVERTGKGGLHTIVSQNPGLSAGDGVKVALSAATRTFLNAQKAHSFYISVWLRTTRTAIGSAGVEVEFGSGGNSQKFAFFRSDGVSGVSASQPNVRSSAIGNALGTYLQSIGTIPGDPNTTTQLAQAGPTWGRQNGTFNDAVPSWGTQLPSWAFYRLYVEDLTISGRSYAQVDALDAVEYAKQMQSSDGRYFNDTFTAPSTIA